MHVLREALSRTTADTLRRTVGRDKLWVQFLKLC
jgi:hypothetical protein